MFGWRKRIGYITPTVMEVVPYEFYRFAPEGVGLVGVSCNIDSWEPHEFEKGLAQVSQAASYLGSRGVDYIIHGGGPLVVKRGKGFEETIVKEIEAASKVQATTGVRAGMEALHHIGARRVAIASPYPKAQDDAMAAYLTAHGFEMVMVEGWDIGFKQLQNAPPSAIYRFASGVLSRANGCDALYLPCAQWQASQIVDVLEKDSDTPVIAYTHANFFAAFKALGLRDQIHGHGRLLASLAEAS